MAFIYKFTVIPSILNDDVTHSGAPLYRKQCLVAVVIINILFSYAKSITYQAPIDATAGLSKDPRLWSRITLDLSPNCRPSGVK